MEPGTTILGGNHTAIKTADGKFIFRDLPLMGPVKKGEKNCPKDWGAEEMQAAVDFAQTEYKSGKYAIPVHKGHHKAVELVDPEYLGLAIPKRVGTVELSGETVPAIFGDIMLKASAVERAQGLELPFRSVEVDWKNGHLTSLALLDSKPPYFHFPLFTVSEVIQDSSAKFEATLKGDYMADKSVEDRISGLEKGLGEIKTGFSSMNEKLDKFMGDHDHPDKHKKIGKGKHDGQKAPAEQKAQERSTFDDAKAAGQDAAKMDGLEKSLAENQGKIAAMEDNIAKRDAAEKAHGMKQVALESLKGYPVGDKIKASIAKFAEMGNQELLDVCLDSYKEGTPALPKKTLAEYEKGGIELTDKRLAKFQEGGAEKIEEAAKYLAQYEQLKDGGARIECTADQYVETQMELNGKDRR